MTIKDIAAAYRQSTEEFEKLVSSIPTDQLDTTHTDGWSSHLDIHNLAATEAQ